jgi:hypothetical protein
MKLLIFLVLIMPACALAQSFTKLDQVFTEEGEGGIDWGDVDGDGDLDFVVSGFDSKVYLNERGAFVKGQSLSFMDNGSPRDNLNHGNVQIADFNKDGNPDILASGWTGSSETTRIFVNHGSGDFSTSVEIEDAHGRYSLARDLNNDNLLDIIHIDFNYIKIFRNTDGFVFEHVFTDAAPVIDNCFVDAGDMDNDGDVDLFLTTNEEFRIYKNEGDFKFTKIDNGQFLLPYDLGAVNCLDYNEDALLDLVMTGFGGATVPVYYNSRSVFQLDSGNNYMENVIRGSMDWGDCDNDGDSDLLITGLKSSGKLVTEVYNNNEGVFQKNPSVLTGVIFGEAKWGDYDNDGDLDILLWGSEELKIYKNDLIESAFEINSAPSPPQSLSFKQEYDTIVVSWTSAHDQQTPDDALLYNVWIKKGPEFLVSPNADISNGALFTPAIANAFANTKFKIFGLEVGQTYEWGVQAIDGGFLSSAFATSSFTYQEPIVGIEESQSEVISIYPNPTFGILNINLPASVNRRITLFDANGRRMESTPVSNHLLDLKEIPDGVYMLNVHDGTRMKTFRVIKK